MDIVNGDITDYDREISDDIRPLDIIRSGLRRKARSCQ